MRTLGLALAAMSAKAMLCPFDMLFRNETAAAALSSKWLSVPLAKGDAQQALSHAYWLPAEVNCYAILNFNDKGMKINCLGTNRGHNPELLQRPDNDEAVVLMLYPSSECAAAASAVHESIYLGKAKLTRMYLALGVVCRLIYVGNMALECYTQPGGDPQARHILAEA